MGAKLAINAVCKCGTCDAVLYIIIERGYWTKCPKCKTPGFKITLDEEGERVIETENASVEIVMEWSE